MRTFTFWTPGPIDLQVGLRNWYFEPGMNVFHLYDDSAVDRVLQDLVRLGAEKVQVFTPGITPEGKDLPTLTTT